MAIISSKPQSPQPERPDENIFLASENKTSYKTKKSKSSPPSNDTETLLEAEATAEEKTNKNNEEKIRPQRLAEYIGQKDLKEVLSIAIAAAKSRKESLDHLLLYGPPGLGKTTMSLILAAEMGVNCKITTAPAIEKPRDIVGLLVGLQKGDVLFIDEIHRLSKMTEEILYPAMEDFRLDITVGQGKTAKTRSIPLKPFTLVGATTRVGSLTSPLRDRFGIIQRLKFYEVDELSLIILRAAKLLKTPITEDGAEEVARRSRGTPRIANRLLRRVRDYSEVKKLTPVNAEVANEALELFNVDPLGLDWTDRNLLRTMIENYNGGPAGLETMAAATGEDAQTIEEVYEPYLMQIGFMQRTPRGRVVTAAGWRHLGYIPPDEQLSLKL
ncbi:MAG: Holliday junction branch migration DNA helicase RuvB [Microcoleaceae cyanobacterium MO_207.B10]|nr:Holliday junction branch migration DNA helicase RuvB [Microcoleaceae cyanobacterium MO_207.B10]